MYDFEIGKLKFIRGGKYPQSNSILIDDHIRAVIDPACDAEKLQAINKQKAIKIIITGTLRSN